MKERFLINIPESVAGWRLKSRGKACDEPLSRTGRGHERWWIDASQGQEIAIYQKGSERIIFAVELIAGHPHVSVVRAEEIIPNEWETSNATTLPVRSVEQNHIEIVLLQAN